MRALEKLPPEIWIEIFGYLSLPDLCSIVEVSKTLFGWLIAEDSLWLRFLPSQDKLPSCYLDLLSQPRSLVCRLNQTRRNWTRGIYQHRSVPIDVADVIREEWRPMGGGFRVVMAGDDKIILALNDGLKIYEFWTGQCLGEITQPWDKLVVTENSIFIVPPGSSTDSYPLQVWSLSNSRKSRELQLHASPIVVLRLVGGVVLSGDVTGQICLWKENGTHLRTIRNTLLGDQELVNAVYSSPFLVIASEKTVIIYKSIDEMLHLAAAIEMKNIKRDGDSLVRLDVEYGTDLLIVSGRKGPLKVLSLETGAELGTIEGRQDILISNPPFTPLITVTRSIMHWWMKETGTNNYDDIFILWARNNKFRGCWSFGNYTAISTKTDLKLYELGTGRLITTLAEESSVASVALNSRYCVALCAPSRTPWKISLEMYNFDGYID